MEKLVEQFMSLGMKENKARETANNEKISNYLQLALADVPIGTKLDDGPGMLLYGLATRIKPQISKHLRLLARYIIERKINNNQRLDAGLKYVLKCVAKGEENIVEAELDRECGVGVVVTDAMLRRVIQEQLEAHKEQILLQGDKFSNFKIVREIRELLPWADPLRVQELTDSERSAMKSDLERLRRAIVPVEPKEYKDTARDIQELMKNLKLHSVGQNGETDGYVITAQTARLLSRHKEAVDGRVHTRFPPEPNGILHIGHAKAININFGYAAANKGFCYLRFDDTNPEKEEQKFVDSIKSMVHWLGYNPYKITYSSDYFPQLYEMAVRLIHRGLAYVCHQTVEEMRGFDPKPSIWRDRPIKESLHLFQCMKYGYIQEGNATLRLKHTLEEGKMDPVAYRIKFAAHHRTKDEWCIYPTYDFTHCICDSLENITHSLCTKEFQSRRSSYYWLCNALDIYCPVQWEYGRLNVDYTVVSKRKIGALISKGIVKDWNDPRLFTLPALRRRGFPAEAINNFCAQMGITGAQSSIDPSMLDAAVRSYLNPRAPRRLVVLEPLKVTITNYPHKGPIQVNVQNLPQTDGDYHQVILNDVVYIERNDFKLEPEEGYKRLSPSQYVGLRHTGLAIRVKEVGVLEDGSVEELICECIPVVDLDKTPAFIQWVSDPIEVEVRLYERLFKHKNPEDTNVVPGGFLTDINPNSLTVYKAYADNVLRNAHIGDQFQFERIGFFCVDDDTNVDRIVFNRTVPLNADPKKK